MRGKKFLDIGRRGKKATVDNTTIHSFPNTTGHVLYFKSNNKGHCSHGKTSTVYVKVKRLERLKAGLFLASHGLLLSGEMGRFHALAICWSTCRGEGRQF